ncbi:cell division protein ZapE [Psychrobium sp. nBUS_13]|uniref:cell division protein ZapE n=1 Tax=Psychrobium sp. nBUS_13 TaxID=3395319 RepID=UPI003EBDD150
MSQLTPLQKYQQDLTRDDFSYDAAQENAVKHLQRLYDELTATQDKPKGFGHKLKSFLCGKTEDKSIKGIYFWGGVGRGKTYLVDTFFEALPFEKKMRVHFHRFMHRVHHELTSLQGQSDPLKIIAKQFAKEAKIICFDEFFVSDITDAMILGGLFQELFGHGVILVATSNIVPDDLYRNGLQRARFLPAITLINENTDVVNVDSGVDYRLRALEQAEIFHYPLDETADSNLLTYFDQLAPEPGHEVGSIDVEGRAIDVRLDADGVLLVEFRSLCDGPRSQVDYMEIARCYHSVLLSNVEQMGQATDDVARRFIAMVDEFYERRVKLIISAEVAMESLYTTGQLNFEFRRCLSRLQEMQSHDYLAEAHKP